MPEDPNKSSSGAGKNLEGDKITNIQQKIESKIDEDEKTLRGEELSGALSKDRTHMSEHRTRMSEHRTDMSQHRTDLSEQRTTMSIERTDLSYQRTALSYERTLMSWIRTSMSLITFGFSIYKFFEEVQRESSQSRMITPRMVGLIMILFGFLGLLFAQIQHHIAYKKLRSDYPEIQRSLSSVLSIIILVFGLLLFLVTLFRQ
jgi:putative membrane protein